MPFLKVPLNPEQRAQLYDVIKAWPGLSLAWTNEGSPVCDVCGGKKPIVIYAAHRTIHKDPIDCWRWCACEACERLLDAENWTALRWVITARMRELFAITRKVSARQLNEAVRASLDEFINYAIRIPAQVHKEA